MGLAALATFFIPERLARDPDRGRRASRLAIRLFRRCPAGDRALPDADFP